MSGLDLGKLKNKKFTIISSEEALEGVIPCLVDMSKIRGGKMRTPITKTCPKCGGSGFSGYGTGYDAVCDDCAGIGEVLIEWKEE